MATPAATVVSPVDRVPRALQPGELFRAGLRSALADFQLVKEVRGLGLLSGIEFVPPRKLAFRARQEAFHKIHPAEVAHAPVPREKHPDPDLRKHFTVLKAAPPLIASEERICGRHPRCCRHGRDLTGVLDRSPGHGPSGCPDLSRS